MKHKVEIAASILSADLCHLKDDLNTMVNAGIDRIHLDMMDHQFVPNLSMGPMFCKALRQAGFKLPIDVHLMVQQPDDIIATCIESGATSIAIHQEACHDPIATLAQIKAGHCQTALAVNPDTSLDFFMQQGHRIDILLIMTVYPGFSGQTFIPSSFDKIQQAHALIQAKQWPCRIMIDGGVNVDNAPKLIASGANMLVSGATLFHAKDRDTMIQTLKQQL